MSLELQMSFSLLTLKEWQLVSITIKVTILKTNILLSKSGLMQWNLDQLIEVHKVIIILIRTICLLRWVDAIPTNLKQPRNVKIRLIKDLGTQLYQMLVTKCQRMQSLRLLRKYTSITIIYAMSILTRNLISH